MSTYNNTLKVIGHLRSFLLVRSFQRVFNFFVITKKGVSIVRIKGSTEKKQKQKKKWTHRKLR